MGDRLEIEGALVPPAGHGGSSGIDLAYQLRDNRDRTGARIFLTGTQALVRMLLLQKKMDEQAGLNTAGFVSGYRGSPLAAVDMEMWRAGQELAAASIKFIPAVNEDLAATAIMGTQHVGNDAERSVDGVFAMWYGKGPGVDRAGDALRHGNAAGTSRKGGVLVILGDDHAAASSTIPNASDLSLVGWGMPIVHPSTVEEYVEFGLWGWAVSRFSSTWVGFKAISETVESGRSFIASAPVPFSEPFNEDVDADRLSHRTSDFLTEAIEKRLACKLDAVRSFARANPIDRMVTAAEAGRLGIVAIGKAYQDLRATLDVLGLDLPTLELLGIRLYKPGLIFPMEEVMARKFVDGLEHILVVEEKNSVFESQLKDMVFNQVNHPTIAGRRDWDGVNLIPTTGQLKPSMLVHVLKWWLEKVAPSVSLNGTECGMGVPLPVSPADGMRRLPYFCSGCPHNTSTKVPAGSIARAGVGCHYMASWMDRRTVGLTQMGGEGADWVGQAPFTKTRHVFQNMGEGTYFHSGFLAIRQAIAARVTMTYKILFNDAVAMTGGQPVDGVMSVSQICSELKAEGAALIKIVTDRPEIYSGVQLDGIAVHHRRELDELQRQFREMPGVTVLVYDQTCAAEKRRRRKKNVGDKNFFPDPKKRLFINPAVCEGCGDCGVQSNCLSIAPLETDLGRKRQIDQASCNKDYSCVEGFCPSFVTVLGGEVKKEGKSDLMVREIDRRAALVPLPQLPVLDGSFDLLVAGVGGTGVITVGQIITMAAHLEGKGASVLDFTALAQKGGSVISHVRISRRPSDLHTVRLEARQASAILACDLIVGALPEVLGTIASGKTKVFANTYVQPLAEFTREPDVQDQAGSLLEKLQWAATSANVEAFDARDAAVRMVGDAMSANMFLLGYAFQKGAIPVSIEALHRAMELNAVAVAGSKYSFMCGRLAAHDRAWLDGVLESSARPIIFRRSQTFKQILDQRETLLVAYQDRRYADGYLELVNKVMVKEKSLSPDSKRLPLAEAVARYYYKLLAYKDEYEVARLYAEPEFMSLVQKQFAGDFKLRFNLAAPVLARRQADGRLLKREFGQWMLTVFRVLASMKRLRGTPLDIFGYTRERKMERKLAADYRKVIEGVLHSLDSTNLRAAIELASLPEMVRGYGHVKDANVAIYLESFKTLSARNFPC